MKKLLLLLILQNFATGNANCQSFSVDDLVTLAGMPSKNVEHFMNRKGFMLNKRKLAGDTIEAAFIPKSKASRQDTGPKKSIDFDLNGNSKQFTLQTSHR